MQRKRKEGERAYNLVKLFIVLGGLALLGHGLATGTMRISDPDRPAENGTPN